MHLKEMDPYCRTHDQNNTNEPTAPYVKAKEINLWTSCVIRELNLGRFARAANGLSTEPPRPLSWAPEIDYLKPEVHSFKNI